MEVIIKGNPEEIATLVLAVQGRRGLVSPKDAIREAVTDLFSDDAEDKPCEVILAIDREEIGRALASYIEAEKRRAGCRIEHMPPHCKGGVNCGRDASGAWHCECRKE